MMQDELVESIRRFSVSDDPLSTSTAQTFVDAFTPLSYTQLAATPGESSSAENDIAAAQKLKQARSTALLTLASRSSSATASTFTAKQSKDESLQARRTDENVAQLLTPIIRSRLADTTPHSLLSALQFFAAVFTVLPTEAHDILVADGIIDLVLEAPDACNAHDPSKEATSSNNVNQIRSPSDQDLVGLAVAELLSSAANSTATRKYLAGQQAVLDWLDIAGVSRSSSTAATNQRKSDAIAITAGLADIKIYRALASEAVQGLTQPTASQSTSQEDHVRKIQQDRQERRRKDQTLCQIVQAELIALAAQSQANKGTTPTVQGMALADYERTVKLSCLEVLAYLTVQPAFKQSVANNVDLLQVLCTGLDLAASKSAHAMQDLDLDSQRHDGAFQLSLVTILSNITTYPPSLTVEEKEVRRLRKFANAQGTKQDSGQSDEDEQLDSASAVEERCMAVLEAKGVEALAAIAVAAPPMPASRNASDTQSSGASWRVNPSKSVRRACGDALLALVTKQDRAVRGRAVQQGALKAVLALSAPVLQQLLPSSDSRKQKPASNGLFSSSASATEVTPEDLAPLQALAKLLISLNPSLLFPSHDGLLSVAPVMCSLLLCPSASRLQKFEALLALTNLASMSPEVGFKVAAFSLESANGSEVRNPDDAFGSTSVLAQACEQVLMEDHAMVRRAWIELLVNLLQVEHVFNFFVSTTSSTSIKPSDNTKTEDAGQGDPHDRLTLRLRMLLGLSEVDEWAFLHNGSTNSKGQDSKSGSEGRGGEASLPTRMACLAILAMVTESRAVIDALLTLDRLFSTLLTCIVLDRSDDEEKNEWERADLESTNRDAKRSSAELEAQVQLNGINLSMRAAYVLFNVLQHLKDNADATVEKNGGFDKEAVQSTLQNVLSHHVVQLKRSAEPPQVEEARQGLMQVLAECLKLARDMPTK